MDGVSAARVSDYESVSTLFKALANPIRAAIVYLLSDWEHTVGQFVEVLGLPQPLVFQYLRILRGVLMVAIRRRGQKIWYSACDQHVVHTLGSAMKHTREGKHDHDH